MLSRRWSWDRLNFRFSLFYDGILFVRSFAFSVQQQFALDSSCSLLVSVCFLMIQYFLGSKNLKQVADSERNKIRTALRATIHNIFQHFFWIFYLKFKIMWCLCGGCHDVNFTRPLPAHTFSIIQMLPKFGQVLEILIRLFYCVASL